MATTIEQLRAAFQDLEAAKRALARAAQTLNHGETEALAKKCRVAEITLRDAWDAVQHTLHMEKVKAGLYPP